MADLRPSRMQDETHPNHSTPTPAQSRLGNQPGVPPDITEAIRLVGMIYPFKDELSEPQRAFLTDMKYKLNQYGNNAQVTWRQIYWLRDIKDRLVESGAL